MSTAEELALKAYEYGASYVPGSSSTHAIAFGAPVQDMFGEKGGNMPDIRVVDNGQPYIGLVPTDFKKTTDIDKLWDYIKEIREQAEEKGWMFDPENYDPAANTVAKKKADLKKRKAEYKKNAKKYEKQQLKRLFGYTKEAGKKPEYDSDAAPIEVPHQFSIDQVSSLVHERYAWEMDNEDNEDDAAYPSAAPSRSTTIVVIPPNWNENLSVQFRGITNQIEFLPFQQLMYGGFGFSAKVMRKLTPAKNAHLQMKHDKIVQALEKDDMVMMLSGDLSTATVHVGAPDDSALKDNLPEGLEGINFSLEGGASSRKRGKKKKSRKKKKYSKKKKSTKKKKKKSSKKKKKSSKKKKSRRKLTKSVEVETYNAIMANFNQLRKRSRSRSRGRR